MILFLLSSLSKRGKKTTFGINSFRRFILKKMWKYFSLQSLLITCGVQLFWKHKQKISFHGVLWVNSCICWNRFGVCVSVRVCMFVCGGFAAAEQNQDYRVNGQYDCCLLYVSGSVTAVTYPGRDDYQTCFRHKGGKPVVYFLWSIRQFAH